MAKIGEFKLDPIGAFRLQVKRDPSKFRITNISAFIPFGKTASDIRTFMTPNGEVNSLMIDKVAVVFNPDESDIDRHNVETLIQHPNVRLSAMTDEEHRELVRRNLKVSNPLFVLTNLDKQKEEGFEKEKEMLEARNLLYNGDLSTSKLIWLSSKFQIGYRDIMKIKSKDNKRRELITNLDKFIKHSEKNVKEFINSIEDIVNTEYVFYINELINIGTITDIGGIYKVGERPVGPDFDSVIKFYQENKELYEQHKKLVIENIGEIK